MAGAQTSTQSTGTQTAGKTARKPRAKSPAKTPAKPAKGSGKPAAKKPAAKKREADAAPAAGAPTTATAATAAALPVREGEDRWTPGELAEVRAALAAEIAALSAEIHASTSQIAEGDATDGAGDDQADTGAKTYEREHELALTYNSRDLLAQNERAVQRIDAGTYGICESCGTPVGKARLQAFPRATLCVSCKQREERR